MYGGRQQEPLAPSMVIAVHTVLNVGGIRADKAGGLAVRKAYMQQDKVLERSAD